MQCLKVTSSFHYAILLHRHGAGGARNLDEDSAVFESLGWQLSVKAADISLVLWYPEDAPGCNVQVSVNMPLDDIDGHIPPVLISTCLPQTHAVGQGVTLCDWSFQQAFCWKDQSASWSVTESCRYLGNGQAQPRNVLRPEQISG